ncbi:immunoglobulin-like domain-containing protein [Cohnella sp. GCM10027633]|uniref:immunoglobulin-like domain-containing protein n=1 Tax=unclassified Cohnella TaxID=2636738 RepID=UPI003645CE21
MKALFALAVGILWFTTLNTHSFAATNLRIQVSDKDVTNAYQPLMVNGVVFVPAEAFNATPELAFASIADTKNNLVMYMNIDKTAYFTVGNAKSNVVSDTIKAKYPPFVKNKTIYVPLRIVVETFGNVVNWDPKTRTVRIAPRPETKRAKWTWIKSEYNELPSSVGDTSKLHDPPFVLPLNFNEGLEHRTEYGERTNRWLGSGFAIASGKVLPGEEISVYIYRVPGDRTIRFQLTERNANLEKISLLKEEISLTGTFTANLPDKDGALYLLSAEVVNERGEVEDTLLSLIEVPPQALNAQLTTDKPEYEGSDVVLLKLENFGPTELFFGSSYQIERYEKNEWQTLTYNALVLFDMAGYTLKPGQNTIYKITLPGLPAGIYRIVKSFDGKGTQLEATLAAPFQILE